MTYTVEVVQPVDTYSKGVGISPTNCQVWNAHFEAKNAAEESGIPVNWNHVNGLIMSSLPLTATEVTAQQMTLHIEDLCFLLVNVVGPKPDKADEYASAVYWAVQIHMLKVITFCGVDIPLGPDENTETFRFARQIVGRFDQYRGEAIYVQPAIDRWIFDKKYPELRNSRRLERGSLLVFRLGLVSFAGAVGKALIDYRLLEAGQVPREITALTIGALITSGIALLGDFLRRRSMAIYNRKYAQNNF